MHKEQLDPKDDKKIRGLIKESGIPLAQFSEAIGWKTEQTLDWWSGRGDGLVGKNIESLAQYLGVSPNSLIEKNIDIALIRQRILQGPRALPENYANNASSYVRTLAHILEYLSMLYGRHYTDSLLRSLNIHPLFFDDLENKINITFYNDIFEELSRRGVDDVDIASLACYIFLSLRETDLGKRFKAATDHQKSYMILAENATLFETNFEYDFQIDSKNIRIIAKPTEATSELLKKDPDKFKRLFSYRKNVFSWFPTLSDLAPLTMESPKCLLRGDSCTIYEAPTPKTWARGRRSSHLQML